MIHLLVNWDQRHVESCRETARVREKRRKSHYTLWLNVNRHLSFILIYVSFPNPFYKVGNINLYTLFVYIVELQFIFTGTKATNLFRHKCSIKYWFAKAGGEEI